MELKVTLLAAGARLPARAHAGDAGLDLYAAESATLAPGERRSVATGIAVEIPAGHAGPGPAALGAGGEATASRSSTAPGLIDSGYRGEVRVLLLNTDRERSFEIEPGDRIAQLLITPFAAGGAGRDLGACRQRRGDGGFGSSGR